MRKIYQILGVINGLGFAAYHMYQALLNLEINIACNTDLLNFVTYNCIGH